MQKRDCFKFQPSIFLQIIGKIHLFIDPFQLNSSASQFSSITIRIPVKWVCLKIGYIPTYSHLIGIMISKTIGYNGVHYFQTNPNGVKSPDISPRFLQRFQPKRRGWEGGLGSQAFAQLMLRLAALVLVIATAQTCRKYVSLVQVELRSFRYRKRCNIYIYTHKIGAP